MTAVSPDDYTDGQGVLTFAPGATEATISIPIVDDAVEEAVESFAVTLGAGEGYRFEGDHGSRTVVNILDNDSGGDRDLSVNFGPEHHTTVPGARERHRVASVHRVSEHQSVRAAERQSAAAGDDPAGGDAHGRRDTGGLHEHPGERDTGGARNRG